MIIDTSAIAAILFSEPERDSFIDAIAADPTRLISTVTVVEIGIVVEARYGMAGAEALNLWLLTVNASVQPFDDRQSELARRAWRRFGKGNNPAELNFGDCCTYALAQSSGEPLLFKGNDFSLTDLRFVSVQPAT